MAENQRKQPEADCSSLIYERFCPARVFFILPSFPIKVEEKPTRTRLCFSVNWLETTQLLKIRKKTKQNKTTR